MKTREPVGVSSFSVAEREGFEPSVPVRVQRFSRPSRSATPAPFQYVYNFFSDAIAAVLSSDLKT